MFFFLRSIESDFFLLGEVIISRSFAVIRVLLLSYYVVSDFLQVLANRFQY